MALDIHALNLLRFAAKSGADFSSVLTFGRLGLWLNERELDAFFRDTGEAWALAEIKGDGYCESFLKRAFRAHEVASLDGSPYEGATLIHDMNLPLSVAGSFPRFSTSARSSTCSISRSR